MGSLRERHWSLGRRSASAIYRAETWGSVLDPTGLALSFIHKGLVVEPVSEKPQRGEIYQPRATPWGTEVERYEP
jgi:hypothetical protein